MEKSHTRIRFFFMRKFHIKRPANLLKSSISPAFLNRTTMKTFIIVFALAFICVSAEDRSGPPKPPKGGPPGGPPGGPGGKGPGFPNPCKNY